MRRPRSSRSVFVFLCLLLLVLVPFLWWRWATAPKSTNDTTAHIFVIPKGQSIDAIGTRLHTEGLIRSRAAFKLMVFKLGLSDAIQAGDFRLKASMPLTLLTQELTHGTLDVWVTLLEGWRREEMARKISEEFSSRGLTFDAQQFIDITLNEEGYLFPDTYLLPQDASPSAVASILTTTFEKKVDLSENETSLDQEAIVIVASLVEREVRKDSDRPLVAGIILKRLEAGWPLQIDATIQYILGNRCDVEAPSCSFWPQTITSQDLKINSRYNTYQNPGLPPAPIANPSLKSLEAVMKPEASEYWYYLSDTEGEVHYATDYEEHQANISRFL